MERIKSSNHNKKTHFPNNSYSQKDNKITSLACKLKNKITKLIEHWELNKSKFNKRKISCSILLSASILNLLIMELIMEEKGGSILPTKN